MIYFYIFLLQSTFASNDCYSYQCSSKKLPQDSCIIYQDDTFYLQECNSGFYCPPIFSPGTSTCVRKPDPELATSWPGEKCNDNSTCAYGYCKDDHCVGKEFNQTCIINDECNPELRCYKGICDYLLTAGDKGCKTDYDCENVCGCNGGVCNYYFSKYEGDEVSCINNSSLICNSGMCYAGYCLAYIQNDNPIPFTCTDNSQCSSSHYSSIQNPFKFYTECKCGYNKNADAYCDLFPGDIPYKMYSDKLKEWYYSYGPYRCNTQRRQSLKCMQENWKSKQYKKYVSYLASYLNYVQIIDNDECIQEIYNQAYLDLTKQHESTSLHLKLGALMVLTHIY